MSEQEWLEKEVRGLLKECQDRLDACQYIGDVKVDFYERFQASTIKDVELHNQIHNMIWRLE